MGTTYFWLNDLEGTWVPVSGYAYNMSYAAETAMVDYFGGLGHTNIYVSGNTTEETSGFATGTRYKYYVMADSGNIGYLYKFEPIPTTFSADSYKIEVSSSGKLPPEVTEIAEP